MTVLPSESIGRTRRKRKKGWVTHSGDGPFSPCAPVQDSPRAQFRILHRIASEEGNTDWWWCAGPGTLTGLGSPFGWVIMDVGSCVGCGGDGLTGILLAPNPLRVELLL